MPTERIQIILTAKDNTKKAFQSTSRGIGKLRSKVQDHAAGIKFAAISVVASIGGIAAISIKAASDAEEIQSKFNVVFRGIAEDVEKWADEFGESVGRSATSLKEFTSGIGDVLKPMGLQTEAAAEMSQQMTELALDVASFNNRQDKDVIRAFTSALTGERESLKTLGIVITEADVKTEAYAAGLAEAGEELTKQAKAQATMNLLFKNSTDAQGDLLRTQSSVANQLKALAEDWKDVREEIGEKLLPVMKDQILPFMRDKLVPFITDVMVPALGDFFKGIEVVTDAWDSLTTALSKVLILADKVESKLAPGENITNRVLQGLLGPAGLLLPEFDNGGVVPGPRGSRQIIAAHGGETVVPTHKTTVNMGGITINNDVDSDRFLKLLNKILEGGVESSELGVF
ncbi:hypothetical protein LCGC14_0418010 [marine sediment metagenome]|uniref:Bacteriophage tail tape measure C-terminal domain-containing protein n=1 Tax=marine sediment metagenome TaxID=412755 RepID=A0A0F9SRV9_9ZZZZ